MAIGTRSSWRNRLGRNDNAIGRTILSDQVSPVPIAFAPDHRSQTRRSVGQRHHRLISASGGVDTLTARAPGSTAQFEPPKRSLGAAELFVIDGKKVSHVAVDRAAGRGSIRGTGTAISPRGDMPKYRVLIITITKGAACHHI